MIERVLALGRPLLHLIFRAILERLSQLTLLNCEAVVRGDDIWQDLVGCSQKLDQLGIDGVEAILERVL